MHPEGEVLSRKTGSLRQYDDDPYGDYYSSPGVFFPLNNNDDRLDQKDFVLGIVVNGKSKAYLPEAIKKVGEIEDVFAGKTFIVRYDASMAMGYSFKSCFALYLKKFKRACRMLRGWGGQPGIYKSTGTILFKSPTISSLP